MAVTKCISIRWSRNGTFLQIPWASPACDVTRDFCRPNCRSENNCAFGAFSFPKMMVFVCKSVLSHWATDLFLLLDQWTSYLWLLVSVCYMPYGYSYKTSCGRPGKAGVICNFWHPGTLTLRAERQSARMSKITNDTGFTRSGTGCFIAVPIWQQWASKS